MRKEFSNFKNISCYDKDGRISLFDLYKRFFVLVEKYNWSYDVIFNEKYLGFDGKEINIPVYAFRTKKLGKSFWILSGIHGEEPAGPNALAYSVKKIAELGRIMPIVFMPMLNPIGYIKNFRYPNEYRDSKIGKSVGDADHFLLGENGKSRIKKPSNKQSKSLSEYILNVSKKYPPLVSIDHHEDELLNKSYIYSQGIMGQNDPIAIEIMNAIKLSKKISVQKNGLTRFGEKIINGIVGQVKDGSVDELIASPKIIVRGRIKKGLSCLTSVVVETPAKSRILLDRIEINKLVINTYKKLAFNICKINNIKL